MDELPVWHVGEQTLQGKAGVAERMEAVGKRVIRDFMPEPHRAFFAQLPLLVLGSVDRQGGAWATLLAGPPGFIAAPTPRSLQIAARCDPRDPAGEGTREGDAVGVLGIELHTRRRNRVNGILRASPADALWLEVDQSFGNCPQYIHRRSHRFVDAGSAGDVEERSDLDPAARATIEAADTFFVASYAERMDRRQLDVSHRGGMAGFVRVGDDGTLTIPDFAGNLFFNTLGNILLNGKAGLVFVDFARGDLLQLSGEAELSLDAPELGDFPGAERLWRFRARRVVWRRAALPLRFRPLDARRA